MSAAHDRAIAEAQDLAHLMTSDLTAVDDIAEGIIVGRTVSAQQISTMSRAVQKHAAGNLPGVPSDEFECCFRAAFTAAGFIVEEAAQ